MNSTADDYLVTVHGADRNGISAAVFRVLASHYAQLLDIEQSTFRGQLSLAALVAIAPDRVEKLTAGLKETLRGYGLRVRVEKQERHPRTAATHVLVLLGREISAKHVHAVAVAMANYGANIDRIRQLGHQPVSAVELEVTLSVDRPGSGVPLRKALAQLASEIGIDIAIERAGLQRRAKGLICFDCDSTLITGEVIEMLAAHAGREAEVAEVTERAMRGEIDFATSLHQRVAVLAGLDASVIDEVVAEIVLTPGARTTIRTLKRLGYKAAVVSGGFAQVLTGLAEDLDLDFVRANTLEIIDGKLTGRVVGDIVDREAKAKFLREFAEHCGLDMSQTVAVGDGANDIDMLSVAGLGIAFNAKPALREVADASVTTPYLDEVLYMLGVTQTEVEHARD
ncbi:phosphoserine phosphatase SerB [Corynebacterium epidermidicanis]|uniref:phosphoserine phosphatase n=1 Tax=Corynebacterium epidermidicanis TaxID=1050174 RepID=A0A0G3GRX3_9CORY|nr:phosphoserine phosphatase SerB [Corynebacterium epidermidicanis]AKK03869.1 phosphoserine phosphatase SerB [Corynebacterium epidermidicanis]